MNTDDVKYTADYSAKRPHGDRDPNCTYNWARPRWEIERIWLIFPLGSRAGFKQVNDYGSHAVNVNPKSTYYHAG